MDRWTDGQANVGKRYRERVPFGHFCQHCGKNINGELITEASVPETSHTRIFFYTENDHQLVYDGLALITVHCIEEAEDVRHHV